VSPRQFFSGSLGVGLAFAFTCFVGFESAVLYSEETADPRRSVPRATFIAVGVLGVVYFLTAWLTVGAAGVTQARGLASSELGNLFFDLAAQNVGSGLRDAMAVLTCTGVLAALLAIQNAASRYVFALGREGALPSALGRYHTRHLSPHIASVTVSTIGAVVVLAFAVAGLDPYLTLATSMVGLSTLGIVLLQAIAAVSVVAFFLRGRPERGVLRTLVVPALGAIGLVVGFVLATSHFSALVGSKSVLIGSLPWLLLVVVVAGLAAGTWQDARTRRQAAVRRPAGAHQRTGRAAPPRTVDQWPVDQWPADQWNRDQPTLEHRQQPDPWGQDRWPARFRPDEP
jgi:amino acid transporter